VGWLDLSCFDGRKIPLPAHHKKTIRTDDLELFLVQSLMMSLVAVFLAGLQIGFNGISTRHTSWHAGLLL